MHGKDGDKFLIRLFNRLLVGERMPEEWRRNVLIPIYKNKGDAQCCGNYRGIKLMTNTMKVWERIIEARLRNIVEISKQQCGFMPGKGIPTHVCLKNVDGKVQGRSKKATLCIRGPRESLRQGSTGKTCGTALRKLGIMEKYVQLVQDMY